MLENILSGLILAAISALTFVAYKHPAGYERLHPILMGAIFLFAICALTWNSAVSYMWGQVLPLVPDSQFLASRKIREAASVHAGWLIGGSAAAALYLTLLRFLDLLLHRGKGKPDGA